jgi:hypothetical protein
VTLTFGASATIGSLRYDQQLVSTRVSSALAPGVGSAHLELAAGVRLDAAPDDDVEVILTGERGDAIVFTGRVYAVERGLEAAVVRAGDAAAALASLRPGVTFIGQDAVAVIRALADAARVDTAVVDAELDLATYVADQGRTGLEHIARIAAWAGAIASVSAEGALQVTPFPDPPAESALRYGREIAGLSIAIPRRGGDLVLAGSGPAGSASAPDAMLHTVDALPEGLPDPGAQAVRIAAPALRTPAAAMGASEFLAATNGAARLRATCWLLPTLRVGAVIEVADAPQPGSLGPWVVTRVAHRVGPGPDGMTRFEATGMGGPGGGLLGQLLSAIGGLL